MSTYLVTGGAGFIGSHLVRRLLREGHAVRVVDDFSTGKYENLEPLIENRSSGHFAGSSDFPGVMDVIEADIRDKKALCSAMPGVDYVLHQAAQVSVPALVADPSASIQTNIGGTLEVLIASRDAGVKRVVQASSSSVYGDTPILPNVETMPFDVRSPYAATKVAGEAYGNAFYHSYGLEYVALRYFNVFGPRQDPRSDYAAVIPRFISACLRGQPPTVYGDGHQSRDFCFVDNVVDANLLACVAPDAAGRAFNIACGERISLLDLLKILGQEIPSSVDPVFDAVRAGDVEHSLADINAAHEGLNYSPKIDFKEGLRQTIAWHRNDGAGS